MYYTSIGATKKVSNIIWSFCELVAKSPSRGYIAFLNFLNNSKIKVLIAGMDAPPRAVDDDGDMLVMMLMIIMMVILIVITIKVINVE